MRAAFLNRMQEIKKSTIVIASVLKPAADTRMHDKLALTLAEQHKVILIGTGDFSGERTSHLNLEVRPLGVMPRISLKRILAPWRILLQVLAIRPEVFIVTTHELLVQGGIARMFGVKLWYDVQENYYLNIRNTNAFPSFLRVPVSWWVRFKEYLLARFVSRFLLAERTYSQELPFIGNRFIVLQNKARKSDFPVQVGNRGRRKLLFSGTINKSTGIFEAIRLATALHDIDETFSLLVIGQCSLKQEFEAIESAVAGKSFITLQVDTRPIDHAEIVDAINKSDLGLILYPPSPSTRNRIPTKLYEYMAARIPIVMIDNPVWISFTAPFHAAVLVDINSIDPGALVKDIDNLEFYTSEPHAVYWEYEAPKLLKGL